MEDHKCFGFSWDAGAKECAGGLDPTFQRNGSNRRERCIYFAQCASKTQEHRSKGLVHPNQLVPQQRAYLEALKQQIRNAAVNPAAPTPPTPPLQPPAPVPAQPVRPVAPTMNPQVMNPQVVPQVMPMGQMVPPQQAMMPWAVPMNFAPPAMQMPGYLTVPEPYVAGQPWYARLGLSVARGMLKATGHVVANFFDHTTFNPWNPNGGQG